LNSKFYLGIAANTDNKELVVGIIQRLKICSKTHLDSLISSSMPGLRLMHLINTPDEIMIKPGYVYFSIIQEEPIWSGIKESGNIALYFPNNYDDLRIELIIIKN
jgi:predicted component of type VI protein secretion system